MPRLLSFGTALAVAAVSLASVTLPQSDAATPAVHAKARVHHGKPTKVLKNYVLLGALASGTEVNGGALPLSSGPTGNVVLGCPTNGGHTHTTSTAAVDLAGGAVHVGATQGKVWSTGSGTTTGSYSTEQIAAISVGLPNVIPGVTQTASLTINGINTEAHTWHDASGFHGSTGGNVLSVGVTLGGKFYALPLPTSALNGQTLTIGAGELANLLGTLDKTLGSVPGVGGLLNTLLGQVTSALNNNSALNALTLASVSLGTSHVTHSATGATANNSGIVIHVPQTKTTVSVGESYAQMRTARVALFRGQEALVDGKLLSNTVTLGSNVRQYMPCQGTNGKAQTTSVASLPLNLGSSVPGLSVGAGTDWQQTHVNTTTRTADSVERAKLADIDIAGELKISAITAQANVYRNKGKVTSNTNGSSVVGITVAGKSYTLAQLNGLEIPGVLKVQTGVTKKMKTGVDYIAVQVTLLGGTGGVINLGHVADRVVRWK